MSTDTRWKLNESRFFLEQMRDALSEPTVFSYFLSAFISSARSITWVMQNEFSEKAGFNEWYEQKQKDMTTKPMFKYLHEHRRLLTHIKPIKGPTHASIYEKADGSSTIAAYIVAGTGGTLSLSISSDALARSYKALDGKPGYFFDDINDRSILEICDEYFKELAGIVLIAEIQFKHGISRPIED